MEWRGGSILYPPQNDPQGVRIVVCVLNPTQNVLYFVLNRVCILWVSVGSRIGGCVFWGCISVRPEFGVCFGARFGGLFWGPVLGVPK
jgi:hypothetical protein